MTPEEYQAALQAHADAQWPGEGIEVRVEQWQPAGTCPRCGVTLDRRLNPAGDSAGLFARIGDMGRVLYRQPHYTFLCLWRNDQEEVPDVDE